LAAYQQLRALTLEERIHIFRRLTSRGLGGSSVQDNHDFDLFHSEKPISDKTFQSYGIADPARLRGARIKVSNLLAVQPPGQWLTDFEALYHNNSTSPSAWRFAGQELGVCDCLWPLINSAVADVRGFLAHCRVNDAELLVDEEQFLEGAIIGLYGKLFTSCARVIVAELGAANARGLLHGSTPQERFVFFVECLRDTSFSRGILEQYPVLVRQAVTLAYDWRDAYMEFLGRLLRDWNEISTALLRRPGKNVLSCIEPSTGDSHNRGRAVIIAQFGDGSRVVYKPKSLTVDLHFSRLVDWVNARAHKVLLATSGVVDKSTYGWSAFVAQTPCENSRDVKEFYRRQGANLALLYLLGGSDLHSENLIAAGDTPKLIDLETLFHPILLPDEISGATKQAYLSLGRSVQRTGLLPYRSSDPSELETWIDLSGLGNAEDRELPFAMPVWEDTASDQMRLAHRKPTMRADQNLPLRGGKRVAVDAYADQIIEGFTDAYRVLCDHKEDLLAADGPIHAFRGDKIRVVVRATNRYVMLLEEAFHPEFMSDALAKEAFFDNLWEEEKDQKLLGRLLPSERRDLWRGDVPYFWTRTDSVDIYTSSGDIIRDALEMTGLDAALECIKQLSEEDLVRQLNSIRASLAMVKQPHAPAPTLHLRLGADASTDPIRIATHIGKRIVDTAIREGDRASWIVLSQTASTHIAAAPAGIDLYDGLPGIALFLAHLGAMTSDANFEDVARAALAELLATPSLRERGPAAGAFAGLGGVIYTLCEISRVWSEPSFIDVAEGLAKILAENVGDAAELDVIGGLAGVVLSALGCAKQTGKPLFSDLAVRAGRALTDRLSSPGNPLHAEMLEGRKWPLSFAHGRAGIAYALIKLYHASGHTDFNAAGLKLAERDLTDINRSGQDASERAPEHAGVVASQLAWCHGKPGVALALKAAGSELDEGRIDSTIAAVGAAITSSPLERSDCICHGNLGNLLLVRELNAVDVKTCSAFEKRVMRRVARRGLVCGNLGLETAGMMEGLAGIGLALLKLVEPATVPNVLTLESGGHLPQA
jgi:class II lanthipeptide synthase